MGGIGATMDEAIKGAKESYSREVEYEKEITKEEYTPEELDAMSNVKIRQIAERRGIEKSGTKQISTLKQEILAEEEEPVTVTQVLTGKKPKKKELTAEERKKAEAQVKMAAEEKKKVVEKKKQEAAEKKKAVEKDIKKSAKDRLKKLF